MEPMTEKIRAGDLEVAFRSYGNPSASDVVVLMHGFPYDVHAYDEVAPLIAGKGHRVIVPWLRGYGPTRFLSPSTMRSGQQGVLGRDLLALLDALRVPKALLAGYDWGGRAACVVSALWPERVVGLVTVNGYNIHDIAAAARPASPEDEHRYWYQYYFHGERGRLGLMQNRRPLCKLLWQHFSPRWRFDDATFERSAGALNHPDFVDVVIHSYRHRYGLVPGAPEAEDIEQRLAARPRIAVPTIALDGDADGVMVAGGAADHARFFAGPYERRIVAGGIGHNVPQEAPEAFAESVLALMPHRRSA